MKVVQNLTDPTNLFKRLFEFYLETQLNIVKIHFQLSLTALIPAIL